MVAKMAIGPNETRVRAPRVAMVAKAAMVANMAMETRIRAPRVAMVANMAIETRIRAPRVAMVAKAAMVANMAIGPNEARIRAPRAATAPGVPTLSKVAMVAKMAIGPHETRLRAPTAATAPGVPTLSTVAMAVDSEVLLTMPKAPTLTVAVIPIMGTGRNSSIRSNLGAMVAKDLKDMKQRTPNASGEINP